MNSPTQHRLQAIFREIFDQPALVLTPELSPGSLSEWDSVAMVQIVLATEQEFGVRFSTEEVASVKTVGDFLRILSMKAP